MSNYIEKIDFAGGSDNKKSIPIELQNKYPLKRANKNNKRYDMYEWNDGSIQKVNNKMEIITTFPIEDNIYMSIYDYYTFIERIINDTFNFDDPDYKGAIIAKISKFLLYYTNEKLQIRNEIDKKIANVLCDFMRIVLNIKNKIIKCNACIPRAIDNFFPHTYNNDGFEQYINTMSSTDEKVVTISISIFYARFIIED